MTIIFEEKTGLLLKAIQFSAQKHRDQRRKDLTRSPYINHPLDVVTLLWEVGHVRDATTLIAAILHDTIEDTQTTTDEIIEIFGLDVLSVVQEVTDDKSLHKQVRKRLQVEHAPHLSNRAKLIKLSDKCCNLRDVIQSPPSLWSIERRQRYVKWTSDVINGVRGTNPGLEAHYDNLLEKAKLSLGIEH